MLNPYNEIPMQDDSYIYGWGYCPDGDEGGQWMLTIRIDFDGRPSEGWTFMNHRDVKLHTENPERFHKDYPGIIQVLEVNPDLAWRHQKVQIRLG